MHRAVSQNTKNYFKIYQKIRYINQSCRKMSGFLQKKCEIYFIVSRYFYSSMPYEAKYSRDKKYFALMIAFLMTAFLGM